MPASSDHRPMETNAPILPRVADQLALIAAHDASYRSFVTVLANSAVDLAGEMDDDARPRGPLDGMTVVIKDNIDVADVETTCASPAMAGYVPAADATIVSRLKA